VSLTVTGSSGLVSSKSATINATPISSFTANPSSGLVPLGVQFTDKSTGPVTAWDWDFGDGSLHASVQNPSHSYNTIGYFTAILTVTGGKGLNNPSSKVITVAGPPPCSAPASPPLSAGMVQGWGCNYFGQINTACLSNIVAIAAGRDH